jgi:hypothetical protein
VTDKVIDKSIYQHFIMSQISYLQSIGPKRKDASPYDFITIEDIVDLDTDYQSISMKT